MSLITKTGKATRLIVALSAMAALSACESWIGEDEAPPLPGERLSVLLIDSDLEPDPRLADLTVKLPKPYKNRDWPQLGGYSDHAMHHLEVGGIEEAWSRDFGDGGDDEARLLSTPVIVNGVVYVVDIDYMVSAFDAETGKRLWEVDVEIPEEDEEAFGGGLAYSRGRLFLTTGFASLISLDAKDGTEYWRIDLSGPARSAPAVNEDAVIAISIDNQTLAVDPATGEKKWSHAGFSEVAGMIGGASAAIYKDVALIPYTSGEVFAIRVSNGRSLWSDSLTSLRRSDALSSLSDVRGAPVIDRGVGYAVSQSGRMVALDMRSGGRIWDRRVGGINTPWIAGDYLFVLANEGHLVAMTRRGGRVLWLQSLPIWEDEEDLEDPINWVGPVLAGDRLILANNLGEVYTISPYSGEFLGKIKVSGPVRVPPVVADGAVYIQTEDGVLHAYR
ncbi:PQQ-binding-like beta-propeller repeat protein [Curvivirga sp.]|uniref:outer membrane protein assembly factor BamB family protein n=1 Tax=Curvivirga sp. TaxID=2856848 RepID=UPI003B59A2F8